MEDVVGAVLPYKTLPRRPLEEGVPGGWAVEKSVASQMALDMCGR